MIRRPTRRSFRRTDPGWATTKPVLGFAQLLRRSWPALLADAPARVPQGGSSRSTPSARSPSAPTGRGCGRTRRHEPPPRDAGPPAPARRQQRLRPRKPEPHHGRRPGSGTRHAPRCDRARRTVPAVPRALGAVGRLRVRSGPRCSARPPPFSSRTASPSSYRAATSAWRALRQSARATPSIMRSPVAAMEGDISLTLRVANQPTRTPELEPSAHALLNAGDRRVASRSAAETTHVPGAGATAVRRYRREPPRASGNPPGGRSPA